MVYSYSIKIIIKFVYKKELINFFLLIVFFQRKYFKNKKNLFFNKKKKLNRIELSS
jgi:hypothetical protein